MKLIPALGLAMLVLLAVWFVALAPRFELGASQEEVVRLNDLLATTASNLEVAESNLAIHKTESSRASLLLLSMQETQDKTAQAVLDIQKRYKNYQPKDMTDEATKCLYLKPPADLGRVRSQD